MRIFFLLLLFFPLSAFAADEDFPPARNAVVTSLKKCLEKLDPEDVIDIRKNYMKPYQECQHRLQMKLQRKKTASALKEAPPQAETPRNYVRVQPVENKKKSGERRVH